MHQVTDRVEFSHKPLWHCSHTDQMLLTMVEDGGYQLPLFHEGDWTEASDSSHSGTGRKTFRLYARKDGIVVWSHKMHNEHCIKFGTEGTIEYSKGLFYYLMLLGYGPVLVPEGQRRPADCKVYDEAMDGDNMWRLPSESLVCATVG